MRRSLPPTWFVASLVLLSSPLWARQSLPTPRLPGFPITPERVVVFSESKGVLGRPTDMVLRPDGSVCVADYGFTRVSCFSEHGKLLFHSGRKGGGPGEFDVPYRLASLPDNSLLVYDMPAQSITRLSPRGKYITRWHVPLVFQQVNKMLALPGHRLLFAGVAPGAGLSADSAMHVFTYDSTVRHVFSFGTLPEAKNREVLPYWGSGYPTLVNGQLVYSRGIPYELHLYREPGRLDRVVKIGLPVSESTDLAIAVNKSLSSTSVATSANRVISATSAVPVGPSLLISQRHAAQKGTTQTVWWDAVGFPSGRLLSSAKLPDGLLMVELAGVVPSGRALLGLVLLEEEPLLARIEFSVPGR